MSRLWSVLALVVSFFTVASSGAAAGPVAGSPHADSPEAVWARVPKECT